MNEILKAIKERRSCRNFKSDMLPDEVIQQICEAGSYAPTGMNRQSPIIIAVKDQALRDQISAMNAKIMGKENFDPFYHAPVILIVLADKNIPTHVYDGSLVMQNLMLAAQSLNIGSIWIHRAKEEFDSDQGKAILKELGIEGDYEGIGHCAIGYAASEANPPAPRKENYIYIK